LSIAWEEVPVKEEGRKEPSTPGCAKSLRGWTEGGKWLGVRIFWEEGSGVGGGRVYRGGGSTERFWGGKWLGERIFEEGKTRRACLF